MKLIKLSSRHIVDIDEILYVVKGESFTHISFRTRGKGPIYISNDDFIAGAIDGLVHAVFAVGDVPIKTTPMPSVGDGY